MHEDITKIYTTNSVWSKEDMKSHWVKAEGLKEEDFESFVSVIDVMF
jgi:hypothetical protein